MLMKLKRKSSHIKLLQGDCLQLMSTIPNKSIDMVLCDLPYGTTKCKWDSIIPFEPLWEQYNRIIKDNGAILLFGQEPFASQLRLSNLKGFKYDWIWKKSKSGSAFTAKYRPINKHEIISVFSRNGGKTQYFPQMEEGTPYSRVQKNQQKINNHKMGFSDEEHLYVNDGVRYPTTVLDFPQKWRRQDQLHPAQKPVELLEYLIKTYTNEDELVLDNCMGSGSTGVAALNLKRKFIGIELSEYYFNISKSRIIGGN